MRTFLKGIEIEICEHITMNERMKKIYIEWSNDNLNRVINEWFYGKAYTADDILKEKELIGAYVINKFFKWCIENNSV